MKTIVIQTQVQVHAFVLSDDDAKAIEKIIGHIPTKELQERFGLSDDECRISGAVWNIIHDELNK